jgi:hypothetical protein
MSPNTQYKTEINIKFGELARTMNWCQTQCIADWGYDIQGMAGLLPGNYTFYFESETDYINFILWKK